ncbi:hypothetical protein A2U01_0100117, partial [Trifolium medium]|nr:hypothetical protein [Trifolium medium]
KPPPTALFWVLFARLRRAMFLRKPRQISPELSAGEERSAIFTPDLARLRRARSVVHGSF